MSESRRDGAVAASLAVIACVAMVVIGVWARVMSKPAVIDRELGVYEPAVEPSLADRLVLLGWISGGVVVAIAGLMVALHLARRPRTRRGAGRGRHR